MLLLGDYHDDCAQTITLRQELPLLQPRPLVLFVEFSRLSPPQSREQIVAEYEELGAGYPCGEAYADLIVGARSLGIRVVGLYNPNVTIANARRRPQRVQPVFASSESLTLTRKNIHTPRDTS